MDELTKAILDAANHLRTMGWSVDDQGLDGMPQPDGEFVRVVREHVAPLIEPGYLDSLRRERIAALRAEADALEVMVANVEVRRPQGRSDL